MLMQIKATLTGVKRGKGDGIIEGKQLAWDYTGFFIMADLPAKGDNAKGCATQEYRFGKADEFEKWKHLPFPVTVDAELSMTTNGKGDATVQLVSIAPAKDQPSRKAA